MLLESMEKGSGQVMEDKSKAEHLGFARHPQPCSSTDSPIQFLYQ